MGLVSVADEIVRFTTSVQTASSLQDAHIEFDKVTEAFRKAWRSDSTHRQDLDRHVFPILVPALRDKNTVGVMNSLVPLFENRRRAEDTIRQVAALTNQAKSLEQGFLMTMLTYLVTVEGVFDETVRFILILADLAAGRTTSYRSVAELTVTSIKTRLQTFGNDFVSTVFDGFVDGHLRNSIAHARFRFDASKNTMVFEDFDSRTQTRSWGPEEMTYPELFMEYYQVLEDTSTFVSLLVWLLQIRGLGDQEVAARLGLRTG